MAAVILRPLSGSHARVEAFPLSTLNQAMPHCATVIRRENQNGVVGQFPVIELSN